MRKTDCGIGDRHSDMFLLRSYSNGRALFAGIPWTRLREATKQKQRLVLVQANVLWVVYVLVSRFENNLVGFGLKCEVASEGFGQHRIYYRKERLGGNLLEILKPRIVRVIAKTGLL